MLGAKGQKADDRLDYDLDFERWLSEGDTITDATATPATGITVDAVQAFGQVVKVWISGGTAGKTYRIDVTATTQLGRVKQRHFMIRISECKTHA